VSKNPETGCLFGIGSAIKIDILLNTAYIQLHNAFISSVSFVNNIQMFETLKLILMLLFSKPSTHLSVLKIYLETSNHNKQPY